MTITVTHPDGRRVDIENADIRTVQTGGRRYYLIVGTDDGKTLTGDEILRFLQALTMPEI
jgi:hypothetical protein